MSSSNPFFPSLPDDDLCRVLCVDDDPIMQRILIRGLVLPGFAVECVCEAREALARFADDRRGFDFLLTDHVMPGMDGAELVGELRTRGFAGPVLVVSAMLKSELIGSYESLAVDQFLAKPATIDALRDAVFAACWRHSPFSTAR